jgi:hypothetical protein
VILRKLATDTTHFAPWLQAGGTPCWIPLKTPQAFSANAESEEHKKTAPLLAGRSVACLCVEERLIVVIQ